MESHGLVERVRTLLVAAPWLGEALAIGVCGSVARDEAGPHSDIDLVVVVPDETPPNEDLRWYRRVVEQLAPLGRDVSVLVYTPGGLRSVSTWYVLRLASDAILFYDTAGIAELLERIVEAALRSGFEEVVMAGRRTWQRKPGLPRPWRFELEP